MSGPADVPPAPPELPPAVARAAEANLEPTGPHSGISFTVALIGSTVIAADSSGDVGRGPGLSLRLGDAATADTLVTVELTGGSMLHEHGGTLFTNNSLDFLVGAQRYVKQSLWLRGSLGLGQYVRRGQFDAGGAATSNTNLFGPAGLVGIGLEVFTRRHFAIALEGFTSLLIERNGLLSTSGLGLAGSYGD